MNMMSPGMMAPQQPPMPSPEQIEQAKLVAEACSWEEVSGILRSDQRREFSIDVETDSTAFEDAETAKQQSIEYVKAMTEMMQIWIPAISMNPSLAPFAKELAMFASTNFKPGRQFEEQLGDAFDQIQKQPPQPNPEMEKVKAEMAMAQQKHQMEMQKGQAEIAGKQQVAQLTAAGKQGDLQAKQQSAQMDMAKQQADMQMEREKAQLQMQIEYAKLQLEREKIAMEREKMAMQIQAAQVQSQIDQQQMAVEADMAHEKAELDRESMVFDAQMKRQTAEDKREQDKAAFKDKQAMMKKQAASK